MSALEIDPEAVIWPEEFSGLSQWDRVKKVLESRKPLIPVSKKVWDNSVDIPTDEDVNKASFESIDLEQTMTSTTELLECLEDFQNRKNAADVHFYTKVGNKLKRIELNDIRYIQVEGKYSAIQLESRQYHVKASLKDLLNVLASPRFVRVSRNYVVSLDHINHIDVYQSTVHIGGEDIPVSRTYKENLMRNVRLL
jgi:DNA-binding LytR/AlgR family response regulator